MVLGRGVGVHILPNPLALHFLELLDGGQVNAVTVVDIAVGVGHGHHLGAELGGLLAGVDGHVAGAGDHHRGAFKAAASVPEHVVGEVAKAVAGGFRPGQAAAVGQPLAGEDAGKLVAQPLVLAEEVADLPGAHADIAGGYVGVGPDVLEELAHEALAKTHDLSVGLSLGVEVAAALAAADGQARQGVFEDLLEAQELDDALIDRRVEPQAALVGADGAVELHPEAPVDVDLALIVLPGHPELDDPLRLYQAVHHAFRDILRAGLHHGDQRSEDFVNRLVKLRFRRVPADDTLHQTVQIFVLNVHALYLPRQAVNSTQQVLRRACHTLVV